LEKTGSRGRRGEKREIDEVIGGGGGGKGVRPYGRLSSTLDTGLPEER